jgi:hypothetical protein
MTAAGSSESAGAVQPTLPRRGRWVSVGVRLLAMVIAAVAALLASNNWCLVLIPAVLAAFVVDLVVNAVRPWFTLRVLVAAGVGVAVGLLLCVGPDWAFHEAFGAAPPGGIRDVRIWRHYIGGPGEHVLIIELTADAAAIQALLQTHPSVADSEKVARWHAAGDTWAQAFDLFVGPGPTSLAHASWQRIRPLEHAAVLDLGEYNNGQLWLFEEPTTGRCVALHVRL